MSGNVKQPRDQLRKQYRHLASRNDKFVQNIQNETLKSSIFDEKEDKSYVSLNSTISRNIRPFQVFVHNQPSQPTQVCIRNLSLA